LAPQVVTISTERSAGRTASSNIHGKTRGKPAGGCVSRMGFALPKSSARRVRRCLDR
jgi:hypothetical protein